MRRQKAQTDFSLRGQAGVSLPGARTRRLCCAPVENSVLHFAVGSFLSQHVIAGTLLSGSSRGEEVMLLAGRTASWVASLVVASLGACHQGCAGTSCCGGHSGEDAETAQACTPCGMPHFYLFIYLFLSGIRSLPSLGMEPFSGRFWLCSGACETSRQRG